MLTGFTGEWTGTNRLYFEGANGPMLESPSQLKAEMVVERFLQVRYDWAYEGKPKEGLLLVGSDAKAGVATVAWVDSFHQSTRVMFCSGVPLASGVSVKGSYGVGEGPDWGWRMDLELAGTELRLTMYNISPEGQEYLAVLAVYRRA